MLMHTGFRSSSELRICEAHLLHIHVQTGRTDGPEYYSRADPSLYLAILKPHDCTPSHAPAKLSVMFMYMLGEKGLTSLM
jgi:hypothetical protein